MICDWVSGTVTSEIYFMLKNIVHNKCFLRNLQTKVSVIAIGSGFKDQGSRTYD